MAIDAIEAPVDCSHSKGNHERYEITNVLRFLPISHNIPNVMASARRVTFRIKINTVREVMSLKLFLMV